MKKVLGLLLALMLLCSLCACSKNCVIEKDSHGRIIKETYHDKEGNVTEERTFTYYESGEKRTQKNIYPQAGDYSPSMIEFQWSEDGLSERELRYNKEGRLTEDICIELYASENENWHKEFDQIWWRKFGIISYYKDGEISHAENEYLEDHTYSHRIYGQEGIIQEEDIYRWCSEHGTWDDKIKRICYDHEGRASEVYEYNIDGYAEKRSFFFYDENQQDYCEWFDEEGKLQKSGTYDESGNLIIHTSTYA